jgi:hypothetical protein
MTITEFRGDYVRLTADNGVIYIPTGEWYSEVVTKQKNIGKYMVVINQLSE